MNKISLKIPLTSQVDIRLLNQYFEFFTKTTLVIMPILVSEALIRENKEKSSDKILVTPSDD